MNPNLIVFEGIDGSGKSSLVKNLQLELSKNFPVKNFYEPTNFESGSLIRKFLQNKIFLSKIELIELFLSDREDSISKNILPSLNSGFHILLDRYFYSMAAYQSDEVYSPEKIMELNLEKKFLIPDKVFYLSIRPEIALERASLRGESERFEKLDILKKVDLAFKKILPMDTIFVDAEKTKEEVFSFCLEKLKNFLD